ncbi:hypothetical protein KSS87_004033 [Heliosperma pusillum]|nr:hypothetical protein KSS87_004033 [Heliosperma pusillum]
MAILQNIINQRVFKLCIFMTCCCFLLVTSLVTAERPLHANYGYPPSFIDHEERPEQSLMSKLYHFLWGKSTYQPVWPDMEFGWRIVVGSLVGFLGAALGSVGGVGGGGIFVPMLTLIIGMIMGAAGSTVYYNLRLRHPTLDMPIIDYDLAVLLQPMLMLGISIGVTFNVIFADWMVTVLLIILFLSNSTLPIYIDQSFNERYRYMEERVAPKAAGKEAEHTLFSIFSSSLTVYHFFFCSNVGEHILEGAILAFICLGWLPRRSNPQATYKAMLHTILGSRVTTGINSSHINPVTYTLEALSDVAIVQIPIALSVTLYEAVSLYNGKKVIASKGKEITNYKAYQLATYCFLGIVAGMVGGLLGLGGGFILGPLFLELGIPPQVASATSTFSMAFSSSMSVVQYYILKRFPVPYGNNLFRPSCDNGGLSGATCSKEGDSPIGRASLIIFILASTILISAVTLGGVGIVHIIEKLENHDYMGFENFC